MSAFGLNRFAQAYAVAANDAGTRIADKPLSCVDRLASDLWLWAGSKELKETFRFLYPFVGGTAVAHSFNLADPASGRITWVDTVTHNVNGITGDGVSGLGNTGLSMPSNATADWLVWCGVYSRTSASGNWEDLGNSPATSATSPSRVIAILCRYTDGNMYTFNGPGDILASAAVPNGQGLFSGLRNAPTGLYAFRNGALLNTASGATAPSLDDPLPKFSLLRGNPTRPCSPRNLAFAYLTNASTNAAVGNTAKQVELYNYVQAFQQRLARAV